MLRAGVFRKFGLGTKLKSLFEPIVANTKTVLAPHGGNNNLLENSNMLFDDVAHEWQAVFVENTYELSVF